MKKCPPGVICVENITLVLVIIGILIICYIYYTSNKKIDFSGSNEVNDRDRNRDRVHEREKDMVAFYPNRMQDPLLNPFAPPLRDERYFPNLIPVMPINVSTNVGAVDTNYRQVGLLTATNSKGKILPLMGRPLFTNRDKWQYYTLSDQNNSVKLPVSRNGRSCTNEYGCDSLYNGDTVYVEGLNEAYKITLYDNDTIRYLPFL